ncbi:MAG: hypothetical protein EXS05_09420 [Planctomycetaceae bacterium]|nr:hypothetical protein [Planctomycetaceae bacterium]
MESFRDSESDFDCDSPTPTARMASDLAKIREGCTNTHQAAWRERLANAVQSILVSILKGQCMSHEIGEKPASGNRLACGICGILLGWLGIHKFIRKHSSNPLCAGF